MKHWLNDQSFRSLLKNTSYLALSKGVAAIAGIATLAFAGRGLGLVQFGLLVLIHSYAQAASGLSKFQSWQLVVRYGGRALDGGDAPDFRVATSFALGLDIASGLVGFVIALALLPLIGNWFGIPDRYIGLAMIYCTLLPTMGSATPVGVLRVLDRFDLLSWQGTTYPIARAILAGIAWASDAPLEAYVAIWYVTDLGGDLYLWFLAWRELKRRELLHGLRPTLKPVQLPNAWRFAIHVNLTTSLEAAWGPIARLIVGGLVGPAAAALYRVAASLADAAKKPADLLNRAYYPQVVRMDMATKAPWRFMLRGMAMAGMFVIISLLVMIFAGKPILATVFGPEFTAAYPILLVLIIVPALVMVSFPLPSMLYALDRPDAPFYARLTGTIAYFIVLVPLARLWGAPGAAAAFVMGYVVMVAMLMVQLRGEHKRVRAR
jgi:O-antigen/teichoic acid export membrane protein